MGKSPSIEFVKDVVVAAGKRALPSFGRIAAEAKADLSFVTEADRANEAYILAEVERQFPGASFLGEETGLHGTTEGLLWACDPIDGTTNFVFGLPHWCVSLGVLDNGRPVLGAIYLPVLDELYWGEAGGGAWCNGLRTQPIDKEVLDVEDVVCLSSNALKGLDVRSFAPRLRCLGSIAAELAYTAHGRLCATVGVTEGIMDVAAGLCICAEVGCGFEYLSGGAVDVAELARRVRMDRHFVVAPPETTRILQRQLAVPC